MLDPNFNWTEEIKNTVYDCERNSFILKQMEEAISFYTKNLGRNISKELWGIRSNSVVTKEFIDKIKSKYEEDKKKYALTPCGKNANRDKCLYLKGQIESLQSSLIYARTTRDNARIKTIEDNIKKFEQEFEKLKCTDEITTFQIEENVKAASVFQELDKQRIEEQNRYEVRQRIFYGTMAILAALVIIVGATKKQNQ